MKYQIVSERKAKYEIRIKSPEDAYRALKKYHGKDKEHFIILTLSGDNTVIRIVIATIGLVNRTLIHPREVFAPAIEDKACSVVIVHNHPSGNTAPSKEDDRVTESISESGKILGIPVLDHLIISTTGYYSYLESDNENLVIVDQHRLSKELSGILKS